MGSWYDYRQKHSIFRQNRPISNPSGRVVAVAGIGAIFFAAMIPIKLLKESKGIYGHVAPLGAGIQLWISDYGVGDGNIAVL